MKKYLSIIGFIIVLLFGYLIATFQKSNLTNASEIVYVKEESLFYLKKDMTVFTGTLVGILEYNPLFAEPTPQDSSYFQISNGLLNGLAKVWHKNGKLSVEANFNNGLQVGRMNQWYANGQLQTEMNYKNDTLNGPYRMWHEDGQLWFEHNIKNGLTDGLQRYWYENGQLQSEENYKNGIRDGLWRTWSKNGQLKYQRNYKDGEFID